MRTTTTMPARDVAEASTTEPGLALLAVLVVVTALAPFSMQVFLPALPSIQASFAASATATQLAFSLSALAIAVTTLGYGPLSDRIGRRPTLFLGLAVYMAGCIVCAAAGSIGWLIVGRILQTGGAAAGLVLARAIVRDLYDRERSATVLAYVTAAMIAAPMMGPAIGGVIADTLGWRMIFVLGVLLGIPIIAFTARSLPETRVAGAAGSVSMTMAFARLLRSRAFLGYTLHTSFSIAVFYSFLAGAPYLAAEVLGRPATEFGLMFAVIPLAFMLGNLAAARLTPRVGSDRMVIAGAALALVGTILLLALVAILPWSVPLLILPTLLGAFGQGLAMPNAQAAIVSVDPAIAGAASGLAGFLQLGTAAVAAQLIGSIQDGTPYPMAIGMTLFGLAAMVAAIVAVRTTSRA